MRKAYKKNIAKKLLKYAKKHPEGFTAIIKGGKLRKIVPSKKKRYAVSITNLTSQKAIIRKFKKKKTGIVGGWYDKNSHKYYVDETKLIGNKSRALKLGKKHKQKAIYDLIKGKSIKVA